MNQNNGSSLLGFLAGAGIGATMGLLFAPRSGRETRERIVDRASSTKDDFDQFLETSRQEWSKASGNAIEAASMTKDEVTDFVRFLFAEGKDLKNRLASDVAETAEEVKQETKKRVKKAS